MLLECERRRQSVSDIIGDDYKAFCDSVISEVPQLTPVFGISSQSARRSSPKASPSS